LQREYQPVEARLRSNIVEVNYLNADMVRAEERIQKLEDVVVAQSEQIAMLIGKTEHLKVSTVFVSSYEYEADGIS
jgi:hypothetical protein